MATAVGDRVSVDGGSFRAMRCVVHDDDLRLVQHHDVRTLEASANDPEASNLAGCHADVSMTR
jgi:hypothetical protein